MSFQLYSTSLSISLTASDPSPFWAVLINGFDGWTLPCCLHLRIFYLTDKHHTFRKMEISQGWTKLWRASLFFLMFRLISFGWCIKLKKEEGCCPKIHTKLLFWLTLIMWTGAPLVPKAIRNVKKCLRCRSVGRKEGALLVILIICI